MIDTPTAEPASAESAADPVFPSLGDCFVYVCRRLGVSDDRLAALEPDAAWSPTQWLMAARRLGLAARVVAAKGPVNMPAGADGPAVAFVRGGAVVLERSPGRDGTWRMLLPRGLTAAAEAAAGRGDRPRSPAPAAAAVADPQIDAKQFAAVYLGFVMLFAGEDGGAAAAGGAMPAGTVGPTAGPGRSARPSGAAGHERAREWFWSGFGHFKGDLLFILLGSLCIHAFALAAPLLTLVIYDRVVPNRAFETLWTIAVGALAMFGFDFCVRLLRGRFADLATKRIDQTLSTGLIRHTLSIEMAARPASAGTFAGKMRQYEAVRDFFTSVTMLGAIDIPVAILLTGLIFWLAGPVGWIPLGTAAAAVAAAALLQPWQRKLMREAFGLNIDRQALATEIVNGLEAVKSANAEAETEARLRDLEAKAAAADLRMKRLNMVGNSITVLCMNLTTVGVLVGCVFRILDHQMTMGGMIACSMVASRAMAPLLGLAGVLLRLQQMLAARRGLLELMALPREDDRPHLNPRLRFPTLRCDRVSYTYPGQPLPSLAGVELTVRPGERVGVIGRTGSGKTTLLRVLSRLHLASEGMVLVDGLDIGHLNPARIREVCSYLPQDPVLFHGSVRENIELGRMYQGGHDEAFVAAATMAGVMEWVNRHPRGFDLPVGERGVLLSGGQRQAVALARAFLNRADVLLLDEPGANFDLATEKQLREALAAYLAEEPRRTLVMATHKMSLLGLVDRLILLEGGRVLADGPRDKVLAALQNRQP